MSAIHAPVVRALAHKIAVIRRRRALTAAILGASLAVAIAPSLLLDYPARAAIRTQVRLHANAQLAMAAIRADLGGTHACFPTLAQPGPTTRARIIVPSRIRAQAVVDLGLPLADVAKPGGITLVDGAPAPGLIVYHDRLDGQATSAYTMYEITTPVTMGGSRLVPILADPSHGLWVIRVDSAGCP